MSLNGTHVFEERGHFFLIWSEDAVIPDELKNLVEKISYYEAIPQMSHRESGVYRHESAECELMPEDCGNAKREKPMYRLRITAKKLEDIKVIVHRIKVGTIHPEESYEERQGGKTRQQLESELVQIQHKNVLIRQFARTLKSGSLLPLIFKATVVTQIDAILDDTK